MRKFLLNRAFVLTLVVWAAFISLPPSEAFAMPSDSVSAFSGISGREAQLDKIAEVLSRPDARAHLLLMGISKRELKEKLARLDDRQLEKVAAQADRVKAAGTDALAIILVLLVIAVLVVLLIQLQENPPKK